MIKAVVFDNFGVLTTDTWRAFVDSLPEGIDIGKARELNRAYDAGTISHKDFLDGVKEVTGRQPQEVESLLQSDIAKNLPLLKYIGELKQRGLKIGLLSNIATNWIRDSFLTPAEQKLFDEMILSYEVGMTKPDPRMFQLACKRLGVDASEAVLVDDISPYCDAARHTGMQAITYEDFKQAKQALEALLSE